MIICVLSVESMMVDITYSRCSWCDKNDELYVAYHDYEWGKPVHDDRLLFENLCLEIFQAGLSWSCILHKREALRKAFADFDAHILTGYGQSDFARLMNDKNIIRNRLKISAVISNAFVFESIQKEEKSFDNYIWKFSEGEIIKSNCISDDKVISLTNSILCDLKRKEMKFIAFSTIYSYLCAIGIISAHQQNCFMCGKYDCNPGAKR